MDNNSNIIRYVNKINLENSEWKVIKKPFRDDNVRTSYLYDDPELGQPFYDYVRYRTLGLCAEYINKNLVQGDVAEVGVFQGFFSIKINEVFPDRMIYLYDTFEGFDENDIDKEQSPSQIRKKNWYSAINSISNRVDLIDVIKSNLKYPHKAIFRKGYFPDSAQLDCNCSFSFVSIDLDIYAPTLTALRFFYPKVSGGGYIFIHDSKFDGVARAIEEFKLEQDFKIVPICDQAETVIIAK